MKNPDPRSGVRRKLSIENPTFEKKDGGKTLTLNKGLRDPIFREEGPKEKDSPLLSDWYSTFRKRIETFWRDKTKETGNITQSTLEETVDFREKNLETTVRRDGRYRWGRSWKGKGGVEEPVTLKSVGWEVTPESSLSLKGVSVHELQLFS